MGGHYGSVQVRSEQRDKVIQAAAAVARKLRIKCLVGPVLDGWVGIYPENNGQDQGVGEAIAQQLGGDVLHVLVHDDSIMAYWYWQDRQLVDSFWSAPGYFGEEESAEQEAMTGRPEVLAKLAPGKTRELRKLLTRGVGEWTFESGRLERLAKLLGIRNAVTAYEYLKEGETTGIKGWKQFAELPEAGVRREKSRQQSRKRQIESLIQQLKGEGLLLAYVSRDELIPRPAVASNGFVVAWDAFSSEKPPVEHYRSPWGTPDNVPIDTHPQINAVAHDATGSRFAAALGKRVVVWATDGWRPVVEVSERDWAVDVALSVDGKMVAHTSREEVVVTDVGSGRRLAAFPGEGCRGIALHPSGQWVVASRLTLLIASVGAGATESRWRELCVGGRSKASQTMARKMQRELAAMDLEAAEREFRSAAEAMLDQFQSSMGRGRISPKPAQIDRMRQEMQKQWETTRGTILAAKEGRSVTPLEGKEEPGMLGFSADGRWLWCGTNRGLRVYSWDEVLNASGDDMPPARWQHDVREGTKRGLPGYVYAAAEEPSGTHVVFGGLAGKVNRMDLSSGRVTELLTMPEREPVLGLVMSGDGGALGVTSQPGMLQVRGRRDYRGVWSVWSYPALCQRAR